MGRKREEQGRPVSFESQSNVDREVIQSKLGELGKLVLVVLWLSDYRKC